MVYHLIIEDEPCRLQEHDTLGEDIGFSLTFPVLNELEPV